MGLILRSEPSHLPSQGDTRGVTNAAGEVDRRLLNQGSSLFLDGSGLPGYVNIMSVATIQAEVLGLPPGERAKLIDVLWDSLASPEVTSREAAWAEESERRIDAFEAGKLAARDAGAVFSDLRKGLRE
jgi:putative addiction module component (TIGR02574 family)